MDGKKNNSTSASIVDELFGKSEAKCSSNGGYFSTVFPNPTQMKGKDTSRSESHWTTSKQHDGKSTGNSSKNQSMYTKVDGKTVYHTEPNQNESSYFGSSVNYGARDFYGTSSSKFVTDPTKSYKNEENDESSATRGDWWQGSLYY